MARKILSCQISHETNTFSAIPTTMDAFRARTLLYGEAIAPRLRGTRTEIAAHLDVAGRYGWELVQPLVAHATPSGRVTAETWQELRRIVLDAAEGVDGMLLALHGAMVADGADDAEGDLLRALRARCGPDVPIAVTLDMHANVTQEMAAHANIILAYRTYPHIDQYEIAAESAGLLHDMLERGARYHTVCLKPPMIDGCDHGRTHRPQGTMPALLAQAGQLAAAGPGIAAMEICSGFPWSDIAETGPSVVVTGTAPKDQLRRAAAPLLDSIWRTRRETSVALLSPEAMVQAMRRAPPSGAPLVVADFTDNPGHGAPGDGVALLRAVLQAGIDGVAFACISDPATVAQCRAAGEGADVQVALGARRVPALYGPPLAASARVVRLSDGWFTYAGPMRKGIRVSLGSTAVLRIGRVEVIVTEGNLQVTDIEVLRSQGIEPASRRAVVVKSQQHFRQGYEPIASNIVLADGGGAVTPDLSRLPYASVRRPVWPLDDLPAEAAEALLRQQCAAPEKFG